MQMRVPVCVELHMVVGKSKVCRYRWVCKYPRNLYHMVIVKIIKLRRLRLYNIVKVLFDYACIVYGLFACECNVSRTNCYVQFNVTGNKLHCILLNTGAG